MPPTTELAAQERAPALPTTDERKYPCVTGADGVPRISGVAVDPAQGFKATELQLCTLKRPHMRAFHFQWLSFFVAFVVWFAYAPLLVVIREDLRIAKRGIWLSNICNVAACVVARFVVGPLGDTYGAVKVQTGLLVFAGACTLLAGTVQTLAQLCALRFLIGVGGATFVITQLWSSEMFATGVVGTANAVTGGWGNCGGGFTILVMGLLYEALRDGGLSDEQAWRRAFFAPGAAVLAVAAAMRVSADECPRGTLDDAAAAGARARVTVAASTRGGFANANSWILGVQYAACFGVELHVNNAMAMYFYDRYGLSVGTAGTLASLFGWMNLFARGLGGLASDAANRRLGMRGRLLVHTAYLFAEGAILVAFSYVDALAPAVAALVCFSICVQAAEGTTFAIVPYVAPKSLGAVAGVVGAGGNVGAVAWGLLFMFGSDGAAGYRALGAIIVASSFLSVFIRIDGEGSLFSNDDKKAPDPAPGRDAEA